MGTVVDDVQTWIICVFAVVLFALHVYRTTSRTTLVHCLAVRQVGHWTTCHNYDVFEKLRSL